MIQELSSRTFSSKGNMGQMRLIRRGQDGAWYPGSQVRKMPEEESRAGVFSFVDCDSVMGNT